MRAWVGVEAGVGLGFGVDAEVGGGGWVLVAAAVTSGEVFGYCAEANGEQGQLDRAGGICLTLGSL